MSRLDSFIRRLQAQRACLGRAAELIRALPGPVLELGLGNGRTYDHLREIFPERGIFVFERRVNAHAACIPDPPHLILGDVRESLASAGRRIREPAVLAHSDIGTPDPAETIRLMEAVAPLLHRLMRAGGVVVSDQEMRHPAWSTLPLPEGIAKGRYFMYRVGDDPDS